MEGGILARAQAGTPTQGEERRDPEVEARRERGGREKGGGGRRAQVARTGARDDRDAVDAPRGRGEDLHDRGLRGAAAAAVPPPGRGSGARVRSVVAPRPKSRRHP